MNLLYYLIAAAALLLLSVLAAVFLGVSPDRRHRVPTPVQILLAGVLLSAFVCLFPLQSAILGDGGHGLEAFFFALHAAFQVFTLDADRSMLLETLACPDPQVAAVFSGYLAALYIAAPILTFGFLLSFLKSVSVTARYVLCRFREVYAFSELNEESLALGADLRKNHRKAVIVYTNVRSGGEGASPELVDRAEEFDALCMKKDILSFPFHRHSRKAKIVFFTMGREEGENGDQALRLIAQYRNREKTTLYAFAGGVESELLFTQADKGKMTVRRVNTIRSLISRDLYDHGTALFANAKPLPDGTKKIGAVLVGLGNRGTEMLKALSWYCQMDGYHLQIDAFDLDEQAEDRLCAAAPELMSEKYNGVMIPNEAEYTIRIHSGLDVATASFIREICRLTDTTYAFIALGSDERNIRTAVELRMWFERMRIRPVIQAVVCSTEKKTALTGITNYRGQPYDIEFIGDMRTSFSEAVVLDSELEAEALRRHLKWGREEEFWRYEYNYDSSVATAIHRKARIVCGIPGAEKREEELTPEERVKIEALEHRRWNAYMRSEGYVYSGSTDKNSRNDLGKMHHDLVDYASLGEQEQRKDSRVGTD